MEGGTSADNYQIKPLSPLRSSDRRKIADQIIATFSIEILKNETEAKDSSVEVDQNIGALGISSIRNSLLPEGCQSARFTTTAGPDLKQVAGTVYVGAHSGEDQRVLWLSVNDRLIPTVYTLWKHPQLVPLLHTQDFVLSKMQGGADLMTPGLARGPPFPAKATKGAVVAVASLQKPSVPQWVGVCEIDVASLQQVKGAKGHAVRGQHWTGDEIWAWSPSGKPGAATPEQIDGWDVDDSTAAINSGVKDMEVEDDDNEEDGGIRLSSTTQEKTAYEPRNDYVEGEDAEPHKSVNNPEKEFSTKGRSEVYSFVFVSDPKQPEVFMIFLITVFRLSSTIVPILRGASPSVNQFTLLIHVQSLIDK